MSKIIIAIFFIFLKSQTSLSAQFLNASVEISGMTCSLCAAGVENSLSKLDFVSSLHMDLNNQIAHLTFKEKGSVNFDFIANSVKDGGFSVNKIKTTYAFSNFKIYDGANFSAGNVKYSFVNIKENKIISGKTTLLMIGKNFMNKKDYKFYNTRILSDSTRYGYTNFVTL